MVIVTGDWWKWASVGVDALLIYGLKQWYHSKVKHAEEIENAKSYELSKGLGELIGNEPGSTVPYACVEGSTHALGTPLSSRFMNTEGVIQQIKFVEHKSKRSSGYWSDVKNIIKDQTNLCPFAIAGFSKNGSSSGSPVLVEVADPLSADFLMNNLTTTHDSYTPNSDSLLSRGMDRLFGEVSKGYQETENMLNIGVKVIGVGKLVLKGSSIVLEAPEDGKMFVLSTLSKKQIVKDLKSNAKAIKIAMWIFGLSGASVLLYLLYQNIRHWLEQYKINSMYREIEAVRQQQRDRRQAASAEASGDEDTEEDLSQRCVVCLENQREVVILECGHVCICGDCARMLPEPRKCPVCRREVSRYVALYMS